jgi:hypothetical protein
VAHLQKPDKICKNEAVYFGQRPNHLKEIFGTREALHASSVILRWYQRLVQFSAKEIRFISLDASKLSEQLVIGMGGREAKETEVG